MPLRDSSQGVDHHHDEPHGAEHGDGDRGGVPCLGHQEGSEDEDGAGEDEAHEHEAQRAHEEISEEGSEPQARSLRGGAAPGQGWAGPGVLFGPRPVLPLAPSGPVRTRGSYAVMRIRVMRSSCTVNAKWEGPLKPSPPTCAVTVTVSS